MFFTRILDLSPTNYLTKYRGDWSWYYSKGLLENGIEPILYIPSLNESGYYLTEEGIGVRFLPLARWHRLLNPILMSRGMRVSRISLYLVEVLNAMSFIRPLREALREDGVEHLYLQEYWHGRFDFLVHRIALPISAADHGGVAKGVLKIFKRKTLKKASVIFCQTEEECRLVRNYSGHAQYQPNGCDLDFCCPDPSIVRKKTILTVARLTNKQKRTSDIIRALALLPDDWTLDIIGTGPDRPTLEKLSVLLNVQNRVRFHGFMSRNDVRSALRECGVFVMASSHEAIAIAALEAMGCGAALVLSRIRTFEELIEDGVNGRLFDVGDVRSLADQIVNAWEHRDALGRSAERTVRERYNTKVLYRRLADALRVTVGARVARTSMGQ